METVYVPSNGSRTYDCYIEYRDFTIIRTNHLGSKLFICLTQPMFKVTVG